MSDTPEYISHDYSPLNKQIEEFSTTSSSIEKNVEIKIKMVK